MKQEHGFTLVEVLASLVIVTIILLSFSQIFIQNNHYANASTEKLVVTQLADAQLERLRVVGKKIDATTVLEPIVLNDKTYVATATIVEEKDANQLQKETLLGIQHIVVTVETTRNDQTRRTIRSSVEGYISYGK